MTKERDEIIARFTYNTAERAKAANVNGYTFPAIVALPKIASQLRNVFERQCNGYRDELAEKRDRSREARLIAHAHTLATDLGASLYVQRDPRGWPLYLIWSGSMFPGETPENSYSQRGEAVSYTHLTLPTNREV